MFLSHKPAKFLIAIFTAFLFALGNIPSPAIADDSCDRSKTKILDGCDFTGRNFSYAHFQGYSFRNTNFTAANLSNTDLSGADLSFANISVANLSGANLSGANFYASRLKGTDLSLSSLYSASFIHADLTGAILDLAYIVDTDFSWSTLSKARRICNDWNYYRYENPRRDLTWANLTGVRADSFSGYYYAYYSTPISVAYGATLRDEVIFGPSVDLSGMDLSNRNLTYLNLSGANLSGTNLSGANLSGTNLRGANMTGVNLSRTYLDNTSLSQVNFFGTDLSGVNFANVNLEGSNLWGANLTNTNLSKTELSGTKLDQVISSGIIGSPTLPTDWYLADGTLVGPDSQLPPLISLIGSDLSNRNLAGVNFSGLDLSAVNLSGANLTKANFSNSNLAGANISGSALVESKLVNSNLTGANLSRAELNKSDLSGANLLGADLSKSMSSLVTFRGANLADADLRGSDLQSSTFHYADLEHVKMSGSILSQTEFYRAYLGEADLSSTYLYNASFDLAKIDKITFEDSYMGNARLNLVSSSKRIKSGHVTGIPKSLPPEYALEKGYLVGPYANLKDASLANSLLAGKALYGSDLSNADLRKADLSGAKLAGATLSSTNLTSANLQNTNLDVSGVSTNFSGADLSCDDPCGANTLLLDNANFSDANLVGRNFENSVITNSKFDGANLSNVNLNKANLSGSRFFGTNLSQTWLLYANLSGAKIVSSNLDRARMATATLDGVSSAGISGNPLALPTNWSLSSGSLVGPGSSVADVPRVELSVSSITGELAVGKTVSVTAETDVNNPAISYQWLLDNQAIGGAVSSTFTITSPIAGHVLTVRVSASKSGYSSSTATARTEGAAELSEFPALTNVSVSGASKLGESLRVSYTNKTEGSTIQIKVSHDGTTWLDAGSGYRPGLEDLGLALKVRVIQSAEGFADQFTDVDLPAISSVIPNAPCASGALDNSVALSAPAIVGVTKYSAKVSGSVGAWARGTKLCQFWLVDNAVSMTQATLKFKLGAAEVGKKIRFVVAATNGSGKTVLAASPEQLVQKLTFEVTQSPVISGNPMVGSVLKPVLGSSWGSQVTFTYQWFRNSQEILGATSSSLVLQAGDLGSTLKVRVCGTRANYETKCLDSTPTATVVTGVFATSPSLRIIGGPARAGTTLSVSSGNWLAGVSLRYQWLRDGSAITGETNMTHVVANADRGHSLTVQVTAAKPGFTDLVKTTAAKQIPGK